VPARAPSRPPPVRRPGDDRGPRGPTPGTTLPELARPGQSCSGRPLGPFELGCGDGRASVHARPCVGWARRRREHGLNRPTFRPNCLVAQVWPDGSARRHKRGASSRGFWPEHGELTRLREPLVRANLARYSWVDSWSGFIARGAVARRRFTLGRCERCPSERPNRPEIGRDLDARVLRRMSGKETWAPSSPDRRGRPGPELRRMWPRVSSRARAAD
jgi:hypothetical protein